MAAMPIENKKQEVEVQWGPPKIVGGESKHRWDIFFHQLIHRGEECHYLRVKKRPLVG